LVRTGRPQPTDSRAIALTKLNAAEAEIQALSFTVRWGPRYDPKMILEHAVCHVLRDRRQLERW